MCQYSATDGFANDWHLVHLGARATGGTGLIITEACAVEARGRISPQDLGIWRDEHVDALRNITAFISSQGSVPGIQLAHAGRKASTFRPWDERQGLVPESEGGWQVIGPSELAFSDSYATPKALDEAGIQQIIQAFVNAAQRALDAGFKLIELHAAHGYLLHSFLSPLANKRQDSYGGSFENRIRLVVELSKALRQVWPQDYPLLVRISATDWLEGGWSLEDSVKLAEVLKDEGVDLIDCSSGGILPQVKIPFAPNYQLPFAEAIKRETGIATGAVGLITEPEQADDIISQGQADLALLGRQLLREPYWPLRAAKALGRPSKALWPPQYWRAMD